MSKVKTIKYYIFKFKLDEYRKFCEQCNLIDTHLIMLGYKLTESEKEMQYALDRFLKGFNCQGHDIAEFCIIPKTIFNESCIYEHIGHKVYLISPVFLTERNLIEYKYPELVREVYDSDVVDYKNHAEIFEKEGSAKPITDTDIEEIRQLAKDIFGEDVIIEGDVTNG